MYIKTLLLSLPMQRLGSRWVLIISIVVSSLLLGMLFLGPAAAGAADPGTWQEPAPVEVWRVEEESGYSRPMTFSGLVEGRRQVDLAFERSGQLSSVSVKEGSFVEAGLPLSRLDDAAPLAELMQARAALRAAELRLEELEAGPRSETIDQARYALEELEVEASLATLDSERARHLLAKGAVAQADVDAADTRSRSLQARIRFARSRLSELQAGSRLEQVLAQRAEVEGLLARTRRLEIEVEKTWLRAPFSGHVTKRFADEGLVVAPGQPILQLVETGALEARVGVSPAVVSDLPLGSPVTLTSRGRELAGSVISHSPSIEESTRSVLVRIALDSERVSPGELVRLRVEDWVSESGFWVPVKSLMKGRSGLWSCFEVVEEDSGFQARRHSVEVLETSGEMAFVRGTPRTGDLLVAAGTHRLVHGQRVVPVDTKLRLAAGSEAMLQLGADR